MLRVSRGYIGAAGRYATFRDYACGAPLTRFECHSIHQPPLGYAMAGDGRTESKV
jgi:hypothetical protein